MEVWPWFVGAKWGSFDPPILDSHLVLPTTLWGFGMRWKIREEIGRLARLQIYF